MSHDPQSPSDAADHDPWADDEPDGRCHECGEPVEPVWADDVTEERFERFRMILCPACAVEAFEEDDDQ